MHHSPLVDCFRLEAGEVLQGSCLHAFVQSRGPETARALALTSAERKCVDLAASWAIPVECQDLIHALPLITTLPHRATEHLREWEQQCFDGTRCRWVVPGGDQRGGIPTGVMARRILVHHVSEAVRGAQRRSPLEATLYLWSRHLTSPAMGGRTYHRVRRLLDHVSSCQTRVSYSDTAGDLSEIAFDWPDHRKPLDDIAWSGLEDSISRFPAQNLVALRRSAFLRIRASSLVTDLYIFLAAVLPGLEAPRFLPWDDLWRQFGAGYKRRNQWLSVFGDALLLTLVAYPEARLEFGAEGLTLHPSLSPFGTAGASPLPQKSNM